MASNTKKLYYIPWETTVILTFPPSNSEELFPVFRHWASEYIFKHFNIFQKYFLERIFDYFGYKCLKLHKERIKYWHWYLVTSKWCSFDVFDVIFILTIHLKELSPADNICFKVNCFFFGKWSMLFQTTILFPLSIFSYIPIVVWNRAQYCL